MNIKRFRVKTAVNEGMLIGAHGWQLMQDGRFTHIKHRLVLSANSLINGFGFMSWHTYRWQKECIYWSQDQMAVVRAHCSEYCVAYGQRTEVSLYTQILNTWSSFHRGKCEKTLTRNINIAWWCFDNYWKLKLSSYAGQLDWWGLICKRNVTCNHVMRAREISLKSDMWHFQYLFDCVILSAHLERYTLLKNSPELDQWFISYKQLKDSQNNTKQRNSFLFLAMSHNQRSRLLIDPARSQHIILWPALVKQKSQSD